MMPVIALPDRIAHTLTGRDAERSTPAANTSNAALDTPERVALVARNWPEEGKRHHAVMALSGVLRRSEYDLDLAIAFVRAVAEAAGDEEVDDRVAAVRDTYQKIETGGEATGLPTLAALIGGEFAKALAESLGLESSEDSLTNRSLTDAANGQRFARAHSADTRYAYYAKKWFHYDGARWATDRSGKIDLMAMQVARDIHVEAEAAELKKDKKALHNWARISQMRSRLQAMNELARPHLSIRESDTDADPTSLNVANGTIHLPTGVIRPHSANDFITRLVPVAYDPDAKAPHWSAFLSRIMDGNDRLVSYVQRAAGYSLSGDTGEHCLFLLFGEGANGKSTLVRILLDVLGDYARPTEFRTLLQRDRSDGVRNDLAALHGLRLVTAIEVASRKSLDEAVVKELTGGDMITARYLYGEFFDFTPKFKLWLAANHKPVIRGVDEGIWRRVRLIPFDVTIPRGERDRNLLAKLREELPGILAWLVRGAVEWYARGLQEPDEVLAATEDYREEMDQLADFLATACAEDKSGAVLVSDLYHIYEGWALDSGIDAWRKGGFGHAMKERGFPSKTIHIAGAEKRRAYAGLVLTDEGKRLLGRPRHSGERRDNDPNAPF